MNFLNNIILQFIFFTCFLYSYNITLKAQTGPGGVGNTSGSSTLRVWVRSDNGVTLSAGKVSTWADQSGYGNNLTQGTAANQPSFATNIFNGFSAVRYIGSSSNFFNPAFNGPGTDGLTIFLFAKGSAYQSLVRYQNVAGTYVVYPWELGGGRTFITSSDGGTGAGLASGLISNVKNIGTARYNRNVATTGFQTFLYGTVFAQKTSANNALPSQPFYSGRYNPGSSEYPTADVSEIIIYYSAINEAQRIIVENYLAAKYDTLLTSNDVYSMDNAANGNFDYDVAGIGQASDGSNHTNSRGTGIVQISNPNNLSNSEFFLWGKNASATCSVTNIDIPSGSPQNVQARWTAVWRASEVGDVGTMDVSFDLTGCTPVTASDLRLLIDRNNDGLFADEVNGIGVISGATFIGSDTYQFSGINIANNERFTLATINFSATPLPIELLDFTANLYEKNKVKLNWITETETDNKAFNVYKSFDALNWDLVGTIPGKINKNTQQHYELIDNSPYIGISYYRLENVSTYGKSDFSDIKEVDVNGLNDDVNVFPNPSSGKIFIQTKTVINPSFTEVIDIKGKPCNVKMTPENKNTLMFESITLSAGTYFIKYKMSDGAIVVKRIVVN